MRISLFLLTLVSLTLYTAENESQGTFSLNQGLVDASQLAALEALNTKLRAHEQEDLEALVRNLPSYRQTTRRSHALDAAMVTGGGLTLSVALQNASARIEDWLKYIVDGARVDAAAAYLSEHPWLYPTIAVTSSCVAGLTYLYKKLSEPIAVDEETKEIIAGYQLAKGTYIDAERDHVLAFERMYKGNTDLQAAQAYVKGRLKKIVHVLHKLEQKSADPTDPEHIKVRKELHALKEKFEEVPTLKRKKVTFARDGQFRKAAGALDSISHILVGGLAANMLDKATSTKHRALDQVQVSGAQVSAGLGILALLVGPRIKNRVWASCRTDVKEFLEVYAQENYNEISQLAMEYDRETLKVQDQLIGGAVELENQAEKAVKKLDKAHKDGALSHDDRKEMLETLQALYNALYSSEGTK